MESALEQKIAKRLTPAGALIAAGLAVQIALSFWVHPLAFVAFLGVACPLVAIGILMFLRSLVAER